MSVSIDERVVEMRFDNEQFEAATKQTMSTLDRLKSALNFSGSAKSLDGLEKAVKNVSMEGLLASVENLEKRFSTLGIVGMRVIQNITDGLMNTVTKGVNFVTDAIISGGMRRAMNLENAHFQLQSILKDEVRVQEVMDAANKSVDGTAYSFDVAAKAASQFVASGITDMDRMDTALRAIVGTSATFNADYESMVQIFTTVAGQGRLMGDQLLQLSVRGANAAATLADFVNQINDGSATATDDVTKAVKAISKGTKVTEGDIRDLVTKGKISFDIFAAAMDHAFGDSAARANETFNGAMSNIKAALARIGAGFFSPLIEQNSKIVELFNAIRVRVNDVKKALVFDESIGNVNALSKQFTDSVLGMAGAAAKFIQNADVTKPMQIFYYWIEIVKNGGKGLISVVKPLAQAFRDVFLSFSSDSVISLSDRIEKLTAKMRLSEESGKNLRDTFKGLFSIAKLVGEVFLRLIGSIVPVQKPVGSLIDLILSFTGALGRLSSGVTGWIGNSKMLSKTLEVLSRIVKAASNGIGDFLDFIRKASEETFKMGKNSKAIQNLLNIFKELGLIAAPYVDRLTKRIGEFTKKISEIIPKKALSLLEDFTYVLMGLVLSLEELDVEKVTKGFDNFLKKMSSLSDLIKSNSGIKAFVSNLKEYISALKDAFSADTILGKVEKFKTVVGSSLEQIQKIVGNFISWFKRDVSPTFKDFSIGAVLATAAGLGIVFAMVKVAKSFESLAKSVKSVPNILNSLSGAIKAYQTDLKASSILKVSAAIGVLAASLVLLSFADPGRLIGSAFALTIVAGAILLGVTKILEAVNKGRESMNALDVLAKGVKKAMTKLSRAFEIKAFGSAIKDFGISVALIVASMAAIVYLYQKDGKNMEKAVNVMMQIAKGLMGFALIMTIFGDIFGKGMNNFAKAAAGILAISGSLAIIIVTLSKLFEMELPSEEELSKKIDLLRNVFGGIAILALALGLASKIAGKGELKTTTFLGLAAAVYAIKKLIEAVFSIDIDESKWESQISTLKTAYKGIALLVLSMGAAAKLSGDAKSLTGNMIGISVLLLATSSIVKTLFKMELPTDWGFKIGILVGMFVAIGGLMIVIGKTAKEAGGVLKAASSILSIALFIGVVTASLMILSIVPWNKLLTGAAGLGVVLVGLATALMGAGEITKKSTYKSILSMTISVGAITASLAVLSMIPWQKLIVSAVAFGTVLGVLAVNFNQISKMKGSKNVDVILSMIITLTMITSALYALSSQPWEGMIASAAALSAVLLSFSFAMKTISALDGIKIDKIGLFILATLSLAPIGIALYALASQPWEGMIASAAALSLVLLSISAALGICSLVGAAAPAAALGILALDAFIINFVAMLTSLGYIFSDPNAKNLLGGGSSVLADIGNSIGAFVGNIAGGFLTGANSGLSVIGKNLSDFMDSASGFFSSVKDVDESAMTGVKMLAETILILTTADVLNGLTSWFTGGSSLTSFGEELEKFGPSIKSFGDSVDGLKSDAVESAANAAQIMSEMASGLPNAGGLAAKIFGDNTLSQFGEELEKFGPHFATYASSVAGIDSDVVTASASAATALSELANSLPNSGGLVSLFTGDNDIAKFGESLKIFGECFKGYYDQVSQIKPDQLGGVIVEFENLIELATKAENVDIYGMTNFAMGLESIGTSGVDGFIFAFQNGGQKAIDAVNDFLNRIISELNSKEVEFFLSGKKPIDSLAEGMSLAISVSFSDIEIQMISIGKNIVAGLDLGIKQNSNLPVESAGKMAEAISIKIRKVLTIHSPALEQIDNGKNVDKGLEIGIKNYKDLPVNAAGDMAEEVTDIIGKNLDISKMDDIAKDMSKKIGGFIEDSDLKNLAEKAKGITTAVTDGINLDSIYEVYGGLKEETNNSTSLIGQMFKAGADVVVKAVQKENEAVKQSGEVKRKAIQQEKSYWEKLLDIKKKGTEKSKYQSMSLKEFEKSVLEDTMSIWKEYTDKLTSTRDSLMGSFDLFSGVEKKTAVSKEQVVKNIKEQIAAYEEYSIVMTNLNARLGESELGEYIRQMGVDSIEQLKVINSMTDEELMNYSALYDQRLSTATFAASTQLTTLQHETEQKLANIFGGMEDAVNVFDFGKVFDGSMESIKKYVSDVMLPIQEANEQVSEESKKIGESISKGIITGLGEDSVEMLSKPIGLAIDKMKEMQGQNAQIAGEEIGENLNSGVGTGMISSTESITNAAIQLIETAISKLREEADINSPSGRTRDEVGLFLTEGIAEGMTDGSIFIEEAIVKILESIINQFTESSIEFEEVGYALIENISTAIQNQNEFIMLTGTETIQNYLMGIRNCFEEASLTAIELTMKILTELELKYPEFLIKGSVSVQNYLTGIRSRYPEAVSTGFTLANQVLNGLNSLNSSFYNAGSSAGQGFVDGLKSMVGAVSEAGEELASAAYQATKVTLDIHSPSRKMGELGRFTALGYVNELRRFSKVAEIAGRDFGKASINGISEAVSSISDILDLDIPDPTIRPIIDLEGAEQAASNISRMFNDAVKTSASMVDSVSVGFSSAGRKRASLNEDPDYSDGKMRNSYTMIQNNYSPKALSRIEIYRQTRNQFSEFKEAINNK